MKADHILHAKPMPWGVEWRLECLPGEGHFTADIEEWHETADELEANGVTVDRSTCWVHDHIDNADHQEEWMKGDDWPEDGPWPVVCSYPGGLDVEYVPTKMHVFTDAELRARDERIIRATVRRFLGSPYIDRDPTSVYDAIIAAAEAEQ